MKILDTYIQKYSRIIAKEQLKDYYESEGYDVKTDYPLARGVRADLFVSKDIEKIVVEIKTCIPRNDCLYSRVEELSVRNNMEYHLMVVNIGTSNNWTIEKIK